MIPSSSCGEVFWWTVALSLRRTLHVSGPHPRLFTLLLRSSESAVGLLSCASLFAARSDVVFTPQATRIPHKATALYADNSSFESPPRIRKAGWWLHTIHREG